MKELYKGMTSQNLIFGVLHDIWSGRHARTPQYSLSLSLVFPFLSCSYLKMACVTMKRPIEMLGSPHLMELEPTAKRRRCGMSLFPTTPPGTSSKHLELDYLQRNGRGSPDISHRRSLCNSPIGVSRGSKRAKRKLDVDHYSIPPSSPPVSPFLNATPPLETG